MRHRFAEGLGGMVLLDCEVMVIGLGLVVGCGWVGCGRMDQMSFTITYQYVRINFRSGLPIILRKSV